MRGSTTTRLGGSAGAWLAGLVLGACCAGGAPAPVVDAAPTGPEDAIRRASGAGRVLRSLEDPGLDEDWGRWAQDVPLGTSSDGSVTVLVEVGSPGAPEGWTLDRLTARGATSGEIELTRSTILRGAEGGFEVVALEGAPALEPTDGIQPVCGSAEEPALRRRAPDLPPCAPELSARYVAAGDLVVIVWQRRVEGEAVRRLILRGSTFLRHLPAGERPAADVDRALHEAHLLRHLGSRWASTTAIPDELPAGLPAATLRERFRGTPGFTEAGLAALVVWDVAPDAARVCTDRYDVRREGPENALTTYGRRLGCFEDGVEVEGEASTPTWLPGPGDPIPAPDGM